LRIGEEVVPSLSHVPEQGLEIFANQAIGDLAYGNTNLVLTFGVSSTMTEDRDERCLTMSLPLPMVNVMPWPTKFGEDVKRDT